MYLDAFPHPNVVLATSTALPRILLIDDDRLYIRRAARSLLGIADLRIVSGRNTAIEATQVWHPDIVILGMFLSDGDAMHLPDELRSRTSIPELSAIYLVKGPGALTRFQTFNGCFLGVVQRDAGPLGLLQAIRSALAQHHAFVA